VFGVAAWQQKVQLPAPYATPSADNPPDVVPRPAGAQLRVPQGFQIREYAAGFARPRFMALGPGGEILLSDSAGGPEGTVYVFQGKTRKKLVSGLDRPYGLAFWKEYLYIAEPTSVKRFRYDPKAMTVGHGEEVVSLRGHGSGHWTRTVLFTPDGTKFYLAVGSRSNVSTGEPEVRAAISRYNPDGSGYELFASGTRNPIGLRFYPGTNNLWAAVQERDTLGDDLVPDYFTHVEQGGFYGWPYAYIGAHPDPQNGKRRPDLVKKTIAPDVPLQPAHVAVLDFLFYTGKQFPKEYQGGAFLALHGSWNRSKRVGQSIVFIPFQNGKPAGAQRDFVTGWMIAPDKREVWGRPVGLLQLPDGSLLISDDGGNKLWQVTYGQ
jgi:glucose/arabinose dehydrogenase